jgi:hypothetical protein
MASSPQGLNSVAIKLDFLRCEHPDLAEPFHRTVILLLQRLGAEFYRSMPFPQLPNPSPVDDLLPNGKVVGSIHFTHPLLQSIRTDQEVIRDFQALYLMTVLKREITIGSVGVTEAVEGYRECIQELAVGRIKFAKALIPYTWPCVAFVDETFGVVVNERTLDQCSMRHLFWCTYFGPSYVKMHGLDFFKNAPVWKVDEFEGGVFLIVTEKYLDFTVNEPKECLKYMRQRFTNMQANRFKIDSSF